MRGGEQINASTASPPGRGRRLRKTASATTIIKDVFLRTSMVPLMTEHPHNVLLPIACPDTSALRKAVAAIIRDIQSAHHETDQQTADRLGVHKNTINNARNETADLGALTIAKIGAIYGAEAVNPYNALYGATAHAVHPATGNPLPDLARAVSALCEVKGPKQRLDALPVLKAAAAALDAYITGIETLRLVA